MNIIMMIKSQKNPVLRSVLSSQSSSRINSRNNESGAIVCGIEAVRARGSEHGIVDSHLTILSDLATKNDVVFGFRPVNPLATQLLEQGYPTKGLTIKGKSADWGPMAGFIPVLQELSKIAGKTKVIKKANGEINACINNKHAVSIPLVINQDRLDTLCRMGIITQGITGSSDNLCILAKKNNQQHVFSAKLSVRNQVAEYAIAYQGEPVNVLAQSGSTGKPPRPITADYDLLLFAVPFDRFGTQDNYKSSSASGRAISDKLLRDFEMSDEKENIPLSTSAGIAKPELHEDSLHVAEPECDRGIISPRLNKFIPEINKALGRTDDNCIVQHGADTQNPYTVIADNYPGVIFLPKRIGHYGGVVMVRNKQEAIQIFKEIKESGFQFFGNDKWAAEIPVKTYRRSSFDSARNALENDALVLKEFSDQFVRE
ncbi:anthrax toxin-like adenylyl cyclase domain-containing protein [Actimicrobium sp. CCI2.3]|uniref:anthrax toxin-like adenylyl cyclase domain-containing protein n=1 Tax=Actimicrobium sp. CCI2.3 TaxID=3048616 RepID=UPI002AB3DCFD|nr:anthrax toxin-like adenylyl cyclase domain-containing protein [Actimicrobium sp. CCI2.3]MDY7575431.1 anthrax toxin-like adenylyl cyclase domain-containing protein [Actimicrobium sp. CCI2.3]MEB0021341.1 anthrax toxin-like adenylyl cyclase domain-containing protein [Actimicrobium sp. CCI2.3]